MKETYILEIDSAQRNVSEYPNSNDYAIKINRPLYDVSEIKLITGRIPLAQHTVDAFNNKLKWDDTEITLTNRDYDTGIQLAANVQDSIRTVSSLASSATVTFDSNTNAITFSNTSSFNLGFPKGNSAAIALGFVEGTHASSGPGNDVVSNAIDIDGPTNLILSVNGDERDDIKKDVYIENKEQQPIHFFGRITTVGYLTNRIVNYNGEDDPVNHKFYRGSENCIENLRVKFFCSNFDKVHPYDFKLRNHFLKFEITCNLDKFEGTSKNNHKHQAIDIPQVSEPYKLLPEDKDVMYVAAFVAIMFLVVLLTI